MQPAGKRRIAALGPVMLAALAVHVHAGESPRPDGIADAPGNLLVNADFSLADGERPAGWQFQNMSRSPEFAAARERIDGEWVAAVRIADADTTELFGYWTQEIPPPAPGRYALRFRIRAENIGLAYWLANNKHSFSVVRRFAPGGYGAIGHQIMEKFIDKDKLPPSFRPDRWEDFAAEVEIPALAADDRLAVRIGSHSSAEGWFAISQVWFGRVEAAAASR